MAQLKKTESAKLFLLEFNELCPSLLSEFMGRRLLPNFSRLYNSSTVYVTDAGEEPPNLEPWIQWLTIHSGLSFQEHGMFHLGEGSKLDKKCLAELLSDSGVRVGVFGSMNTNYETLNGYMIPDAWEGNRPACPPELQTFSSIVSRLVQDSSKESSQSKSDLVRLGVFLLRNGLSTRTVAACLAQLWNEWRDPGVRWKRPVLLDRISYEVFRCLNRRYDVRFATLFCNSTAHFQHYYWRNMSPAEFQLEPSTTDHESLNNAILYGYQSMDRLVGWLLRDYPDTVLLMCTALSQKPWADTTKCTFRPIDFEDLLRFAGISLNGVSVNPVMAEQFFVKFQDELQAREANQQLAQLTVDGAPLFDVEEDNSNLFVSCALTDAQVISKTVLRSSDSVTRPFSELFHIVHAMRSGRHHPDGALWWQTGRHSLANEKIALTRIAPTILEHFAIPCPSYMQAEPLPFVQKLSQPLEHSQARRADGQARQSDAANSVKEIHP